ncbi:arginase family protein [Anabaena sp. CS-542/02]|nr:arginase family protein [Anabaena sp. CS-542/02]MDB9448081.1 arginase family protein [Anabaena sp. CS-542/02]
MGIFLHNTKLLGYFQALANKYPKYGILHIDDHVDLRDA